MIVMDSSCWISIFKGDPGAMQFADALDNADGVLVPSICLYEVGKFLIRELGEDLALEAIAAMKQFQVIDIDANISLDAAFISLQYKIPFADSIILTVTRKYQAILWTKDAHFKDIDGVRYFG